MQKGVNYSVNGYVFGDIIDLTYDYMCQDYNVQQIILWAEKNYVHDFVLAYNSLKTRHGWPS